jgi:hypothetical protein
VHGGIGPRPCASPSRAVMTARASWQRACDVEASRGVIVRNRKRKRRVKSLVRTYEVKAEIANATLARARSALTLEIYRRQEKLGELQIGRGSLFWAGARRQSAKRVHWGRFAEMMDRLAYGEQRH